MEEQRHQCAKFLGRQPRRQESQPPPLLVGGCRRHKHTSEPFRSPEIVACSGVPRAWEFTITAGSALSPWQGTHRLQLGRIVVSTTARRCISRVPHTCQMLPVMISSYMACSKHQLWSNTSGDVNFPGTTKSPPEGPLTVYSNAQVLKRMRIALPRNLVLLASGFQANWRLRTSRQNVICRLHCTENVGGWLLSAILHWWPPSTQQRRNC